MEKCQLTIILRVYPGISKKPFYPFEDKFQLFSSGLLSLKAALTNIQFKLIVLLDACPGEYRMFINRVFNEQVEFLEFNEKLGNEGTFIKQLEIGQNTNRNDIVFFLEDDYLFVPDSLQHIMSLFENHTDIQIVTPYDHIDYYEMWIHKWPKKKNQIRINYFKFRNVNSTTLSFFIRSNALNELFDTFKTFKYGNYDVSIFWSITKQHIFSVFSLFNFIHYAINGNATFLKAFWKSWLFNTSQILFGKKYAVYAPQPSMATHFQFDGLPPNIDWMKILKKYLR